MTSPVSQITDHVRRMLDDQLSQFHNSPELEDLVTVLGEEVQRLEDLLYDFLTKRMLANATGDILDWIGEVVGVQRLDRTDDDFRRIIQVAVAANDSDGGAQQIQWIASELVGADVRYIQEGVAYFRLEYESDDTLSDELKAEALELIGLAVPAGVGWRLTAGEATLTGRYDEDTYGAARYGTVIGGSS